MVRHASGRRVQGSDTSAARRHDIAVAAAATFAGLAMHLWAQLSGSTHFSPGFLLWSITPYLIAAGLLCTAPRFVLAGALLAILAADTWTYLSVHVWPNSSTVGLLYVFMPFWNIVMFLPAGAVAGWILGMILRGTRPAPGGRRSGRRHAGANQEETDR
jgi:hypothetical protein